jgi:quercetin dioxygenase-like cupin family protein
MMMTRRDAVAAFALFAEMLTPALSAAEGSATGVVEGPALGAAEGADAAAGTQTPAAAPRPPVFKGDLPNVSLDGWDVTVSHVDYEPGRVGAVHHHAGFVLVYVLEGTVIAKISGQGEEKVYKTGQMFYEPPGATHEVSKNASQTQPAKLLAMIFAKKGSTLTTPGRASGL